MTRWTRAVECAAYLVAVFYCTDASARPFRVDDIPNGNHFSCLNCHTDMTGMSFTPFGSDARSFLVGTGTTDTKHVNWTAALCNRDSDGDGYTNGVELGDPNCTWVAGQPSPAGLVTNPGDPTSYPPPVCGNGKLDAGEECEGTQLSVTMCSDIQMGTGTLSCKSDCTFDKSACSIYKYAGSGGSGDGSGSGCAVTPLAATSDDSKPPGLIALVVAAVAAARRARRPQ